MNISLFKKYNLIIYILIFLVGIFFLFNTSLFSKDISSQVETNVKEAVTIRQKSQKEEDKWFIEKKKLEAEYEKLEQENKALSEEIEQLEKEITIHEDAINKTKIDLCKIRIIKSKIMPFITETYKRLSIFIKGDIPFLVKERRERLINLNKTLKDPVISISSKFEALMEALFIEAEYGNTIETYQDSIRLNNNSIYVNIFRLGRVALFFQSLDGNRSGYFNPVSGWQTLPKKYNKDIKIAIGIAERKRPAEIINLPIGKIKR